MEENPCEAVHTNVYGTHNVADMAVKYDVDKFIMISTDKAVNPTNVRERLNVWLRSMFRV